MSKLVLAERLEVAARSIQHCPVLLYSATCYRLIPITTFGRDITSHQSVLQL